MFWHSADYSLYTLFEDYLPYDHYVTDDQPAGDGTSMKFLHFA